MIDDDPVTLSMAAVGGSALIGSAASVAGGIQANKAGQVAQQQAKNEALGIQEQTGAQIATQDTEAARTISRGEAGAGAAHITQGSAMPVLSEEYAQARIRDAYSRFSGNLASNEALYAGSLAKYQGKQALQAGIVGGVTNILGGVYNVGDIKMKSGRGGSSPGAGVGLYGGGWIGGP